MSIEVIFTGKIAGLLLRINDTLSFSITATHGLTANTALYRYLQTTLTKTEQQIRHVVWGERCIQKAVMS